MKYIQLDLFYEKGNGYYKYWYRIYRYLYDTPTRLRNSIPQP
jgi:hypothetical protein